MKITVKGKFGSMSSTVRFERGDTEESSRASLAKSVAAHDAFVESELAKIKADPQAFIAEAKSKTEAGKALVIQAYDRGSRDFGGLLLDRVEEMRYHWRLAKKLGMI